MIYEKRGRWCFRDDKGTQHKFNTLAEAKAAYGFPEIVDAPEEEEGSEEETSSNEQETLFSYQSSSEEEV